MSTSSDKDGQRNANSLVETLLGRHRHGGRAYKVQLQERPESTGEKATQYATDVEQAALGLEYERRGYTVEYVPRGSLSPGHPANPEKIGELTKASVDSPDLGQRRVSLIVDDVSTITAAQREMRATPEAFEAVTARSKRHADASEKLARASLEAGGRHPTTKRTLQHHSPDRF